MLLRYKNENLMWCAYKLGAEPITIGRSSQADLTVRDEKLSRLHFGVRLEDKTYVIKDLESKNGTYVNDEQITQQELEPGDDIRAGDTHFFFEKELEKGNETMVHELQDEIDRGKGYSTILREIVDVAEDTEKAQRKRKKKQ